MEPEAIRDLIRQKLQAGRLPLNSMPRFWSGPADGCDKAHHEAATRGRPPLLEASK
jgi:hypothetical protein